MTPTPTTIPEYRAAWVAAVRAQTEAEQARDAALRQAADATARIEIVQRSCNRYVSALTSIRDGAVGWRAIAAQALDEHGMNVEGLR